MELNPPALTAIRERSGLSKSKLASLVGIAPSYVTELEQGKKPGGETVIVRIADTLKVPVAAIIRFPEHDRGA
jgi:transcriptional regulator with XRE-family HTH domain